MHFHQGGLIASPAVYTRLEIDAAAQASAPGLLFAGIRKVVRRGERQTLVL